jgi:hypothetical protein
MPGRGRTRENGGGRSFFLGVRYKVLAVGAGPQSGLRAHGVAHPEEPAVTLLVALLLAAEPATSHQVSIPLADYEALRSQGERPALTVIELLRVEGSFARRDLSITLSGRASGTRPTAEVLRAEGARLHSCAGEAMVSRTDSGAFAVTPLAQAFTVRCQVALDGSDRLAAEATRAVLEVASSVSDGELVASGSGERSFSVVRRLPGAERQDLPPTATGRYRVTLLPDEARFAYRLEVRNPARGHRRFEVALREAEHVEGVDAPVAWDAEGSRYRFDLPPGDTVIVVRGRLAEARFAPPIGAALQYLLLESHPLVRPDVQTRARRVGVGETGLDACFRGAQAFLLGGDATEVSWTPTRLEALKTAGLALNQLRQVFFLGADGRARAEATLAIDNQGAPALTLPGAAGPSFASVGGEPSFLTRDRDGNLSLPLAQGAQEVVVQGAQDFWHGLGLGVARLELPRPGVPASRAAVQLRYPAEWIPLYEELAPESRLHLLELDELLALLAVVALAERLLAVGAVARSRRWLLVGALAVAAALLPGLRVAALALLVLAWAALGGAVLVRRLRGAARLAALAAGGVALLFTVIIVGQLSILPARQAPAQMAYDRASVAPEAPPVSAAPRSKQAVAEPNGADAAAAAPGYAGLPARIQLPPGARQTSFSRELLATDAPRPVVAIVVASRVVALLSGAAGLLLLAVAVLLRRDLAAGARALVARVRAADPAVTAGG